MRFILLAVAIICTTSALGATVSEGQRALERGNFQDAKRILEPYAEAGHRDAQYSFGEMYADGSGVLQDYVSAHKWLNLAAASGHSDARSRRNQISQRMTPAQLAEAQASARAFQPVPIAAAPAPRPTPQASAPIPQPRVTTARSSAPSTRATLRDIQTYLAELGYDPGPADGVTGRRTRSAIRNYQTHSDLRADGQPSTELRNALAIDLGYADPAPLNSRDTDGAVASAPTPRPVKPTPVRPAPVQQPQTSAPIYVQEANRDSTTQPSPPRNSDNRVSHSGRSGSGGSNNRDSRASQSPMRELKRIVGRGRRRGEADRQFFTQIDSLLERHSATGSRVLISDTFADGNFTANPPWKVHAGEFWVAQGEGLRTRVTPRATNSERSNGNRGNSGKDIGLALLGALLSQHQQGKAPASTESPTAEAAEIVLPVSTRGNFTLDFSFASSEKSGHFEIGLFTDSVHTGYRLVYIGTREGNLQLLRVKGDSRAVVDFYDGPLALEDRAFHRVILKRDRRGQIEVSVDGKTVMQAQDRSFTEGFSGVVIQNKGGNYAVKQISVGT